MAVLGLNYSMWDLVPCPGVKPGLPFHWAHGVLATGSPGTSQESVYALFHVYDFMIGSSVLGSYTVDSLCARRLPYWFTVSPG